MKKDELQCLIEQVEFKQNYRTTTHPQITEESFIACSILLTVGIFSRETTYSGAKEQTVAELR